MTRDSAPSRVLEAFSAPARSWFASTFAHPTPAQELGWDAIARGQHTLLLAPTGSGKTLAAFLYCLDRLFQRPPLPARSNGRPARREGVSVLYISPLKALSYDIERNLRAPLAGLRLACQAEGREAPDITVATRTGDTPTSEREDIRRNPPDILITTPESLYLMLTSRSREVLRTVETVIVDEIHTMASTKRGAHLSLSLERLEALCETPPQRIGLSATQRPLDEVARYLGGNRHVEIADAGSRRELDLRVVVPVEDMTRMDEGDHVQAAVDAGYGPEARNSIWPAVYPELLDLVRQHRSTLVFVNNRRLAERIAQRVNELADEELVKAHHGSVSREQRTEIEDQLKSGQLPGLICTSSLELGIDMGAVDLVVLVESPHAVSRGLQRIGRAGHQVGGVSTGRIYPKYRGDLLESAILTKRMREGLVEAMSVPRNPLDVLAQHIVSMCAVDEWTVDDIGRLVHRSYNFESLSRDALEGVLEMLAGQYPSDEFAELRPRIIWDRSTGAITSRGDAKTVAIVNGGTIPDRGLYGVFLGEGGPRVGELDEEMVFETRPGETFLLGATTWRVEAITHDRVIVAPAPGEPGKMPFWRGDGVARPLEFGRAVGAFTRELAEATDESALLSRLQDEHDLDERAARNLVAYVADQQEATGAIPTDRTIVIERYLDELGDWRVVILTPFGGQVHAPWALALEAILSDRSGFEVQAIWSDDGIAVRFAGSEVPPADDLFLPAPEEIEDLVVARLGGSSLFAAHFRENAARSLLLPRRRPGTRMPLWLQRQRSAQLLAVASRYPAFPIVLETYRDCLRDVFDLPGLVELLTDVRSRRVRVRSVETQQASPFARSLAMEYIASYMYEVDMPMAERRAQALALDRDLLRDLLGEGELRELLDPRAIEETELELQSLAENRKARNADQLHDLLRRIGDLAPPEIRARVAAPDDADAWLRELEQSGRACPVRIAGHERWIAIEDAGRYRDALGVAPPVGIPDAFLRPGESPLGSLVARWARTNGPFHADAPSSRWGLPRALVLEELHNLQHDGTILHGGFRPGGSEPEWCDAEVLRIIKRRSLSLLRREVEPVGQAAYARFLLQWHGVGAAYRGLDRLREALDRLQAYPVPASSLERDVLAARVDTYEPRMLDELGAAGEYAWAGRGALGASDGRVALFRRDRFSLLAPSPPAEPPSEPVHTAILDALRAGGALFFADLLDATREPVRETRDALWDLVWAGLVTNDTVAPLRALALPRREGRSPRSRGSMLPPDAVGRWSLTPAGRALSPPSPTERAHALAEALLERHGIVTREAVLAEGVEGGFTAVYPVLKAMEESGRVRRGYFVEGLGGAQFALPGAVDRLRAEREPPDEPAALALAATDPAQPYGGALPWPPAGGESNRTPQRAAGAYVALVNGEPALYLERGGRGLLTFPVITGDPAAVTAAIEALASLAPRRPRNTLTLERIDGAPAVESSLVDAFTAAGFKVGYRGLVYRAPRPGAVHA